MVATLFYKQVAMVVVNTQYYMHVGNMMTYLFDLIRHILPCHYAAYKAQP